MTYAVVVPTTIEKCFHVVTSSIYLIIIYGGSNLWQAFPSILVHALHGRLGWCRLWFPGVAQRRDLIFANERTTGMQDNRRVFSSKTARRQSRLHNLKNTACPPF